MLNAIDWKVNRPCCLRLAGSRAMPSFLAARGECGAIGLAVQQHPAPGGAAHAVDRLGDLRGARADQAVERDDLAGADGDVDVGVLALARPGPRGPGGAVSSATLCSGGVSSRMPPTMSSTIRRTESSSIGQVPEGLPVAHDGDLVGDDEQLVEPVGDVDDRDPGGGQPADDAEQHLDLGVGEDRRGLVEDEHLGVADQGLGDGDLLLLGDGQLADRDGGVAGRQADQLQQLHHARVLRRPVDPPAAGDLPAGEDVLGDGEVEEQLRFLIDGRDAEGDGVSGAVDGHRLALEGDPPGVGGRRPGEDLDQRGLARAVLADQGVDPAGAHGHVRVTDGPHGAVALGHPGHGQPFGAGVVRLGGRRLGRPGRSGLAHRFLAPAGGPGRAGGDRPSPGWDQ